MTVYLKPLNNFGYFSFKKKSPLNDWIGSFPHNDKICDPSLGGAGMAL